MCLLLRLFLTDFYSYGRKILASKPTDSHQKSGYFYRNSALLKTTASNQNPSPGDTSRTILYNALNKTSLLKPLNRFKLLHIEAMNKFHFSYRNTARNFC